MVQVNSMAQALESAFAIPLRVTGVVTMVLIGLVILGGIKRIGAVAASLVPFMCVAYVLAGLVVLVVNAERIPESLDLIFTHAFSPIAATGGFAGAAVMAAIRYGVARGDLLQRGRPGGRPGSPSFGPAPPPTQCNRA